MFNRITSVMFRKLPPYVVVLGIVIGITLALILCIPLKELYLTHKYKDYSPEQIVQAYHNAVIGGDVTTIYFLSYSHTLQQNTPELSNDVILLFMWTDSIVQTPLKTYVYSTFKYGRLNFGGEFIIVDVRIREALYYEGTWKVGLGNVIDIGNRIKNFDAINIEV